MTTQEQATYIFLDDVREPPEDGNNWRVFRKVDSDFYGAVLHASYDDKLVIVSLDHDLGEDMETGYDAVNYFEHHVVIRDWRPNIEFRIHSANPVGRANMQRGIDSIMRIIEQ